MPAKRESGSRKRQATEANAKTEPTTALTTSTRSLPPGVSAVRLLWTDFAGIRRCRVIPASRWESVASGASPIRLARACAALQTTVDALTPGAASAGVVGDVALFPVTRPATLPWHPPHAVSLCELRKLPQPEEEGVLASSGPEKRGGGGDALTPECFSLCPRGTARRAALVAARSKPPMALRFGFETEFKLSERRQQHAAGDGPLSPPSSSSCFADPGSYSHSLMLDAHSAVLDEVVASLDLLLSRAGIADVRVEQWHAEAGDGAGSGSAVFELVTSHAGLVEAADALVLTRETVSQVARRRGFDAVFLPKPDGASAAGLGCHTHFSVNDRETGENLTLDVARKWRERTTTTAATTSAGDDDDEAAAAAATAAASTGEAFVAGVCSRVDALLAFTTAGPTSHLRLQPGCWSGAPSSSSSSSSSPSNWGPANKEAPLRTLADNVEFKPMDATANPYLAAAALAAAGIEGVAKGEGLPPPRGSVEEASAPAPAAAAAPEASLNGDCSAAASAAAAVAEAACTKAVEALLGWEREAGGGLSPIFSPEALETLVALRRADLNAMRDWSYEQTRERLSLLY